VSAVNWRGPSLDRHITVPVRITQKHASGPIPQARTALFDLEFNFADDRCRGTMAYADQLVLDDPDTNPSTAADTIIAVRSFCQALLNAT
jgi:hypothetical protein